mmetsp:Transcript_22629/g.27746  ORF Transcript_22629/g.27746 Transcript_22629/m.27746 type:complete len:449 (-) Transcript_22629:3-1349(-)
MISLDVSFLLSVIPVILLYSISSSHAFVGRTAIGQPLSLSSGIGQQTHHWSHFSYCKDHRKTFTTYFHRLRLSENGNINDNINENDEAEKLKSKAEKLREEIRNMEEQLKSSSLPRSNNNDEYIPKPRENEDFIIEGKSLKNKRVLVVGANGRLGSMVTRYLLRSHPEVKEVVAAVHYVGEATTRGWGRLSYEVGAEDGVGYIGAAWSEEDERNARFEYSEAMKDYNLQNLRIVDVELLDPLQCTTITEDVDSVIWCATDFDGNRPKAIASLNAAFLFRAIAAPTKGRVEIEGLTNILGGLKQSKQNKIRLARFNNDSNSREEGEFSDENEPTAFILVSTSPAALNEFETPFGEFNGLKRQGEQIVQSDFPSLTHTILQFSKYEDNFVDESLDIQTEIISDDTMNEDYTVEKSNRKINRRDAAKSAVDALLDDSLEGNKVEVWTAIRG